MNDNELIIRMEFAPKTYDIDALGIVGNITYVRWLEDLRTEFLNQYLPWEELQSESLVPVLSETNINYQKPVRMGETVTGRLQLNEIGRSVWRLSFEFERDSELVLTAKQSGLFVDSETKKPRQLTEDLRKNIQDP